MSALLLRSVTLPDGAVGDVRCVDGRIDAVATTIAPAAGETIEDLAGWLVLPAPAEPHAHLDKALTADRVPNLRGDLPGAIAAWTAYRPNLTFDDIVERAETAARLLLANGCTAIRTHVDVADDVKLRCVEALVEVRRRLADVLNLQIVALLAPWADWGLLAEAIAAGADVVGGCPHIADDPTKMQLHCLDVAGEHDRPIDLHTDEHLNAEGLDLRAMAAWVRRTGFIRPVTASHCCSLGVQDDETQRAVAAEVAEARVAVVTLPQTNLFLQGRDHTSAVPRGLTALRPLLDAGATLAAGADNLQDPFNTVGRGDPLETASLLVMAGHLLPHEAYTAITDGARRAMGLPSVAVAAGAPAELMIVRAASLRAAVAAAPMDRIVVHRGRVVARTTTARTS